MSKLRSTRDIVVWAEVKDVLHRKIESAIEEAGNAPDARSMGEAQGKLKAYREMLVLPKSMVAGDEMEEAEEKSREAIRLSQDPKNWRNEFAQKGR
jgi:hypothetical protein